MFNEYNIKITYIKEGKLDIKRTAKAFAKFYIAKYARIAVIQLKRTYHAKVYSRLHQPT